jgi:hypothetical protein
MKRTHNPPRFALGQAFMFRAGKKEGRLARVVDILQTYDSVGDRVDVVYVIEYAFCAQMIKARVCDTTIARALANA